MKVSDLVAELAGITDEQLQIRLGELEDSLLKLRLKKSSGQLETTSQLRWVRRHIARAKTEMSSRRKTSSVVAAV